MSFYAKRLDLHDFGIYQNYWIQFNTLFAIAGLGFSSFLLAYRPEKLLQILTQLKVGQKTAAVSIMLVCALVFAGIQWGNTFFIFSFFFFLFNAISLILNHFLIVFKRYAALTIINALYCVLFFGAHCWALGAGQFSFTNLVALLSILLLGKMLVSGRMVAQAFSALSPSDEPFHPKQFWSFWRHMYFFELSQLLIVNADKFVLSLLVEEKVSAIYQSGAFSIPLLSAMFGSVSSAALMQLATSQKDKVSQADILRKTSKLLASVAFPVFFFFYFFSSEFLYLLFSPEFTESVPIFKMSLLMIPFSAFNFSVLLKHYEQGKAINMGVLADVCTTGITVWPLYYWMGLKGIPLAFVLGTAAQMTVYLVHHVRILGMSLLSFIPLRFWLISIAYYALLCYVLHMITSSLQLSNFQSLLLAGSVVGISVLANFSLFKRHSY